MDLNEALAGRRSVRDYTTRAVDETTICCLIDAAVLAPSAVNQQPYTFTVVRDQAVLTASRAMRRRICWKRCPKIRMRIVSA